MTDSPKLKYLYGPVASWRLGRSLGIDLISRDCTCSFDCVYCQLGPTRVRTMERDIFVPTAEIVREIGLLPDVAMDYATFSGMGEPTLALNLGEAIDAVHELLDVPVAVLTNATLIDRDDVAGDLERAETVMAKLDAADAAMFQRMNRPVEGITFEKTVAGIRAFGEKHPDKLVLQMMFCQINEPSAPAMAELARTIPCREIVLNTPLRPSGVAPISRESMERIKALYAPLPVRSVYDAPPVSSEIVDPEQTARRRPESE